MPRRFSAQIDGMNYIAEFHGELSEEWHEEWAATFYDAMDLPDHVGALVLALHEGRMPGFIEGYGVAERIRCREWPIRANINDADGVNVAHVLIKRDGPVIVNASPMVMELFDDV